MQVSLDLDYLDQDFNMGMKAVEAKQFETEIMVLESDLDSFGHVNNAVYLEFYERARWQFISDNGYGLYEVQRMKKGPVILECNVKFKRELKLRETFKIRSQMTSMHGKIMNIHQEMIKNTDKGEVVASEADFVIGFFDLAERKLIDPTPEWMKAIGLES